MRNDSEWEMIMNVIWKWKKNDNEWKITMNKKWNKYDLKINKKWK